MRVNEHIIVSLFHKPELRPFGDDSPNSKHHSSDVAVRSL